MPAINPTWFIVTKCPLFFAGEISLEAQLASFNVEPKTHLQGQGELTPDKAALMSRR